MVRRDFIIDLLLILSMRMRIISYPWALFKSKLMIFLVNLYYHPEFIIKKMKLLSHCIHIVNEFNSASIQFDICCRREHGLSLIFSRMFLLCAPFPLQFICDIFVCSAVWLPFHLCYGYLFQPTSDKHYFSYPSSSSLHKQSPGGVL